MREARRFLPPALAAIGLVCGAAAALPLGEPGPSVRAETVPEASATASSGCTATGWKQARPVAASPGDEITVTLRVEPRCWSTGRRLHVAFVLDASDSMYDRPTLFQALAAKELASTLALGADPSTRAAVVSFAADARLEAPLTDDEDAVLVAIERRKPNRRATDPTQPDGNTRIELGLREALREMRKGRAEGEGTAAGTDTAPSEILVLFSDGIADGGCGAARRELAQAVREGVLCVSVCVAPWCDDRCLEQLASTERLAFEVGDLSSIRAVIQERMAPDPGPSVTELWVTDTLGADVALVAGSAAPAPLRVDADGRGVAWRTGALTSEGVTFSFRVRPLSTGRIPTNREAFGVGRTSVGSTFAFTFPVPVVAVSPGGPSPSPTPLGPATEPAPPTPDPATVTAPPMEPTPEPTPAPHARRACHLPVALRLGHANGPPGPPSGTPDQPP